MRIDCHHHLWSLERGDYDWLSEARHAIYRDFQPADLKLLLDAHGIDATIVIQATNTLAETEFMLELSDNHPWIAGVIGWMDLEDKGAVAVLERFRQHPKFKGVRPMRPWLADADWVTRPGLNRSFDALVEMELIVEWLALPKHLPAILQRLDRHHKLKSVINHFAKPNLKNGMPEEWLTHMMAVAVHEGAFCKLSGLMALIGAQAAMPNLQPAVDQVINSFGTDRLMFGTDWPVLNETSSYGEWVGLAEALLAHRTEDERDAIFGGNANGFYDLDISG